MNKLFKVKVGDSYEYEFKNSDAEKLDILPVTDSKFHLVYENKSIEVICENSNFNKKQYSISINGSTYPVKISNALDLLINEMGFSVGSSKKANDIKAPMPGIILSIDVEVGQEVTEGDTLLILEAMKMENAIGAPKDGIIKAIHVSPNEAVDKGALMIEME